MKRSDVRTIEKINDNQDTLNIRWQVTALCNYRSLFPTIQALGAVLEHTDSFCPKGYLCDAGARSIRIDAFGNVKRCPALRSDMSMGSILDGTFRMLKAPEICVSDHCSCNTYGKIEKAQVSQASTREQEHAHEATD